MEDGSMDDVALLEALGETKAALYDSIGKVVVGQQEVIERMLIALIADGHCLFVGVPGLAKTLLVQTLAQAVGADFGRIQFTPDLMPSDITGTDVLEEDRSSGRRELRFVRGPVFTNLLLADEINRTPSRIRASRAVTSATLACSTAPVPRSRTPQFAWDFATMTLSGLRPTEPTKERVHAAVERHRDQRRVRLLTGRHPRHPAHRADPHRVQQHGARSARDALRWPGLA